MDVCRWNAPKYIINLEISLAEILGPGKHV